MSVSKNGEAKITHAEDNGGSSRADGDASSSEGLVSLGDIIEGTATHQATIFERKAALVNAYVFRSQAARSWVLNTYKCREIDKFGFGRYQQCIWVLCGFGYFLDLAWTQGVGLMATAVL